MIRRRLSRNDDKEEVEARGFDAFELRLGDVMRGERATMGKSLLDVERELRIKANYVAAIENADPDAFDTPGFIPGYVRSYARYLNMDPDEAFKSFCVESGFSTAHGMSAEASSIRKSNDQPIRRSVGRGDPLISPNTPFIPASEGMFSSIEPGAIGSALVLVALIGGIGYGGWSVLNEVQRVQFAPVENTPDVLSDLDPLEGVVTTGDNVDVAVADGGGFQPPVDDRLDRLYRPEALDVPVMVARDAPISTLNPAEVGTLRPELPETDKRYAVAGRYGSPFDVEPVVAPDPQVINSPKVVADAAPGVKMVAVRPAWVRVRASDGSVIFEGILNAGDSYDVPSTEKPATLRAGESGSIYFAVNGKHYGPVGQGGSVTSGLELDAEMLTDKLKVADLSRDQDLSRYVAELQTGVVAPQE
ncbi:helix-turn-helix domain-containing protein [uncultured Roseovarius sp.]|uniref:helix-turn-helix domain-containing protein n=1 Tax=uncultured Roseovarius sp. TaxID=293344 RepID=UPI00261D209C|nr:helix-turn-helix domain-containing protein [uncultured Roseovarius sp.]